MYFIYILRCEGGSLYSGITTDPARRLSEHLCKRRGARYTRLHKPLFFERLWTAQDRATASSAEAVLKKMKKADKEAFIQKPSLFVEIMCERECEIAVAEGECNVGKEPSRFNDDCVQCAVEHSGNSDKANKL